MKEKMTVMRRLQRGRVWIGMLGGFLISGIYILKARAASKRLEGEDLHQAAARLPYEWADWGDWWLTFCTAMKPPRIIGLTEELRERLRTSPVFLLGNHFSMGEMWRYLKFVFGLGHVARIVTKSDMLDHGLGQGMQALGIGWFINRNDGSGAVQAIRAGIAETRRQFEQFVALLLTDGTKPTKDSVLSGRGRLLGRNEGRLALLNSQLAPHFTTTRVPATAGAAATIKGARSCEGAIALYLTVRSPRHVADPQPVEDVITSSWLLMLLNIFWPKVAAKIAGGWAFLVDIVDQGELLIGERIEIKVEELDLHSGEVVVASIGPDVSIHLPQDLRMVPSTDHQDLFAAWVLAKGAEGDQWIAEISNTVPMTEEERRGTGHQLIQQKELG